MSRILGILSAAIVAAVTVSISALTAGCTKSAQAHASQPPDGWAYDASGVCRKILVMPETRLVGCVPVDRPGRLVFCDYEVGVVEPGAVATAE